MAFWIGLAIFILASIVAERLLPPQYKNFMPILVMVVLTFFGLFRSEIGTDYDWYIVLFDTVKIYTQNQHFYYWLNSYVSFISLIR